MEAQVAQWESEEVPFPTSEFNQIPAKAFGLYDPRLEKDSCGVGVIVSPQQSHRILQQAQKILCNLAHRGAELADNSGDGAGICTNVPHAFFQEELGEGVLPAPFRYGVGMCFFPNDEHYRAAAEEVLQDSLVVSGLELIQQREVPINRVACGGTALRSLPAIRQIFVREIGGSVEIVPKEEEEAQVVHLNRRLYVARRRMEKLIALRLGEEWKKRVVACKAQGGRGKGPGARPSFYVCSLSCSQVVYKGQLTCPQLFKFFRDLTNPAYVSGFAMVHRCAEP